MFYKMNWKIRIVYLILGVLPNAVEIPMNGYLFFKYYYSRLPIQGALIIPVKGRFCKA
jgi:hypothetical protein